MKYLCAAWRAVVLLLSLVECLARFLLRCSSHGGKLSTLQRAAWMQQSCSLVLRRLSLSVARSGPLPVPGLVAANHLSYFDVVVFGAAFPCVFVAKSEVRAWPFFGLLAGLGGTIFVERGNRASTSAVAAQIKALLEQGVSVMLFPEGTSSDGSTVLRFHPSLFEPAVECQAPVTAAAVGYSCDAESNAAVPEKDLCYFGDEVFLPQMLKTLGRRGLSSTIAFSEDAAVFADRKTAAAATWRRVMELRGNPLPPATGVSTEATGTSP